MLCCLLLTIGVKQLTIYFNHGTMYHTKMKIKILPLIKNILLRETGIFLTAVDFSAAVLL